VITPLQAMWLGSWREADPSGPPLRQPGARWATLACPSAQDLPGGRKLCLAWITVSSAMTGGSRGNRLLPAPKAVFGGCPAFGRQARPKAP